MQLTTFLGRTQVNAWLSHQKYDPQNSRSISAKKEITIVVLPKRALYQALVVLKDNNHYPQHLLGLKVFPLRTQDAALPLNPQVLDIQTFVWKHQLQEGQKQLYEM